jgi:hypothetical protein
MAEETIFIAMCYILQVFWIGHAKREDGSDIPVEPKWADTLNASVQAFSLLSLLILLEIKTSSSFPLFFHSALRGSR